MKRSYHCVLFSLIIAGLACTTNTEDLVPDPDDGGGENPPVEVSYASSVQPIFNGSCTGCHGNSGNVNLSSYSALMNSVGANYGNTLVVSGDANASGLVDKIEPNPAHGSRMPIGGALSPTQIQTIRTWINQGAKNN
ncbi:MAG: c-type cytochrome [Balneola sp.]